MNATTLGIASAVVAASAMVSAQRSTPVQPANRQTQNEIRVTKVRPSIYMLTGAGSNITVMPFDQGVVVVDAGTAAMADQVLAAIGQLSTKPIADIINTSATSDHVGGNEKLHGAGRRIPFEIVAGEGPMVIAHENVMVRMSAPTGKQAAAPEKAWPNETYHVDFKKLAAQYRGGEQIELMHMPAAHSDGDSIVWFRRADVIATGDVFMENLYPTIEVANGGTINGTIDALNKILATGFVDFRSEGGTAIIPGHGRLCDLSDVGYYRDMITIIRDRVQDMIKKGMTLDQVKAGRPSRDYDTQYSGSPDVFVESIYRSLATRKP